MRPSRSSRRACSRAWALGTAAFGPLVDAGGEPIMLAGCGLGLTGVGIVTVRIRRRRTA